MSRRFQSGHFVAEEEEMARRSARERDGNDRGQLGPAEVVDVVVLGDHEALPLALRERIDGAVSFRRSCAGRG
jgi:hypothetical protein